MHRSARRHRVCGCGGGTPVRLSSEYYRPLDNSPPDLSIKTLLYIPLGETDGWTCIMIEIGKSLILPGGFGVCVGESISYRLP